LALLQNEMPVPKPVMLLVISPSSLDGEFRAEPQLRLPIYGYEKKITAASSRGDNSDRRRKLVAAGAG
jgi:hypothetical protein